MNRGPMGPDDSLGLQIFQDIHLLPLMIGPVGIHHAVDLHQVDIIGIQLLPEAIHHNIGIGTLIFRNPPFAGPYF